MRMTSRYENQDFFRRFQMPEIRKSADPVRKFTHYRIILGVIAFSILITLLMVLVAASVFLLPAWIRVGQVLIMVILHMNMMLVCYMVFQ